MTKRAPWNASPLLACLLLVAPAQARTPQPAQPASTHEDSDEADATDTAVEASQRKRLAPVVVTARHRVEELQKTPVSVSSLDAVELQTRGADDLSGLAAAVPNVTIYAARPFNNAITAYIRGVGQSETVWGVEPGVGVYVDDVYLARPQSALLDILDVERIEVLRGPQGTLYGRNTIGGAIKYLTRRADAEFSGSVGMTLGDHGRMDFKAVVNAPISDRLHTRTAFARYQRDGFGSNLFTGEDVSARDATVARLAVDWSVNDRVELRLSYDSYRDRSGTRGAKRLAVNPNDPARTPPDEGNYDVRNGMADLDEADADGVSATIDWDIHEHWKLKSVTARRWSDSRANIDFDGLPLPISDLVRALHESQTSQEFQLSGSAGRMQAISGLYLFDGKAGGRVGSIRSANYMLSTGEVGTRSAALYANLTWDWDRFSIDTGLRYTHERKAATVLNRGYRDIGFTIPNGQVSANFTDSEIFSSLSPKLNVSFRPSSNAMLYAQASRGFKAGGYNIRANTRFVPESGLPFLDESAIAYELGAKTDWFDGSLTLNAAAFRTLYRDIQLSVFTSYDSNGDGVRDSFFGDFKNAGAGTLSGAELEIDVRPGGALRWLAHVGYLDTRYDQYISGGLDIADQQRFTNAPRWTTGISAMGDFALASGAALTMRIDANYRSKAYPTTDLSEYLAQPGHALVNASLVFRSPRRRWEVAMTAQNLTNREYRTTGYDIPVLGVRTAFYGAPRTGSLLLTWFFP